MIREQKIRIDRVYKQPFYLIDKSQENEFFVFQISGSTANLYTVKINPNVTSFNDLVICNCPDSSSWARNAGVKCKHCCFVFIKVLGLEEKSIDSYEFNSNIKSYVEQIKAKCQNLVIKHDLINETYREKWLKLKNGGDKKDNKFAVTKKLDEDDDCPICFSELETNQSSQCPTCRNVVHTKCIKKWLSLGNKSCVYCRGDWSDFSRKKSKYFKLSP